MSEIFNLISTTKLELHQNDYLIKLGYEWRFQNGINEGAQ